MQQYQERPCIKAFEFSLHGSHNTKIKCEYYNPRMLSFYFRSTNQDFMQLKDEAGDQVITLMFPTRQLRDVMITSLRIYKATKATSFQPLQCR